MFHEFYGGDPTAERFFAFQFFRSQQETNFVGWISADRFVFGDDNHHRAIIVVTMVEGFLAVFQFVEIEFTPIFVDTGKTVKF